MQIIQNLRDIGLSMTLMALDVLRKMPGNRENSDFFYKIEFLKTNSYKMRNDSMKVTFEVDSTQLKDYLLILAFVTERLCHKLLFYRLLKSGKIFFFVPVA